MANTNNRHLNYYKRKANIIKEYVFTSYPGVNKNSKDVDNLKQLANIIINLTEQKDEVKNQMIVLAKETKNFECINSLFGIGELSASLIIAELKDITRFNNIKQINASCGLDPTIVQSGKSIIMDLFQNVEIDMLEKFYLIVVEILLLYQQNVIKKIQYMFITKRKNRKVNISTLV
jgi:hypothetical protein